MTVTAMPQTTLKPDGAKDGADKPPKSKKKLIIILVAVLAIGGGGYMFLSPKPAGPPKPGDVVILEPIQINLADGHYLRVGIALQLVAGAAKVDGSKALDATIEEFSGVAMADANDPAKRETDKAQLVKVLGKRYDGDVMGVYFTEFVTQ